LIENFGLRISAPGFEIRIPQSEIREAFMSEQEPAVPRVTPAQDPDNTKGSQEDRADSGVMRRQVPFRGFPKGQTPFEIASPCCDVDSLPGESGQHGHHSGEEPK
jgi:hypothetical protein